jgi:hypothetical protein
MASHLEIDCEALAIDVQVNEEKQIAVLTFVSIENSLEVSLPMRALEQFRARISHKLPQASPHTPAPEPPTDHLDQQAGP